MRSHFNNKLKENARKLRREMTREEKHLWYDFLKNQPCHINRQEIIDDYIVDFYCHKAKLVIEIDGMQHMDQDNSERDALRDDHLRSLGLNVVRYTNHQINYEFDRVCEDLKGRLGL